MHRILVIRGGAIGDFVLTLPAIKLLRDNFPHAHLEILGYRHIAALAENRFYANAVRSLEDGALAGFFAREATITPELMILFSRFRSGGELSLRSRSDLRTKSAPLRSGKLSRLLAEIRTARTCGQTIGATIAATRPRSRRMPRRGSSLPRQIANSLDAFLLVLRVPSSRFILAAAAKSKNWPTEKWLQTREWFLESGSASRLLIAGGEADEEQLARLRSALPRRAFASRKTFRFHTWPPFWKNARSSSATTAASRTLPRPSARNASCFSGRADPAVWAPANRDVRVVRASRGMIGDLPVEDVTRAVNASGSAGVKSPNDLRTDAHRHQHVKKRRLDLQDAGAHLIDQIEEDFVFGQVPQRRHEKFRIEGDRKIAAFVDDRPATPSLRRLPECWP